MTEAAADGHGRAMNAFTRWSVGALRASVRWLRTNRESISRSERIARTLAMVPLFSVLLIILRIRAWLYGPIDVFVTSADGDRFHCRPPDLVQMYLWLFDIWEPDLTAFISERLREGDGFIDVGANVGYFSVLAARRVGPAGRILAVEASPAVFGSLNETIRLNDLSESIRAVNKAAAATRGSAAVYAGPHQNIGLTTTVQTRGFVKQAVVDALPLDDLVTPDELRAARIVKIDVEGAEAEVLAGMHRFFAECRDDAEILVELSPLWWADETKRPIDVLHRLFAVGFHAYEMDNSYWPWRYMWPHCVRRPTRCKRDLTKRVKRLDLVLSRRDSDEL